MASFFSQGGTGTSITIYRGLNVQSSCQGVGITVGWGRVRISGNMIWYGDFKTHSQSQGGKGGGGATSYQYSASFVIGLLQTGPLGPIAQIREIWEGQSIISLVNTNGSHTFARGGGGTVFTGAYGQAPWGHLTTNFPAQACPYNYLSYVALQNYNLGGGANVPNLTFLVDTALQDAPNGQDAQIFSVVRDVLTNPVYGLGFPTGRLDTCSAAVNYWDCLNFYVSPFVQDQTQASDLLGKLIEYTNCEFVQLSGKLSIVPYGDLPISTSNSIMTETTGIPVSPYQVTVVESSLFSADAGVTNVATGAALTRVSGTPGQGQYAVSSGVYTFSKKDYKAGITVTISYAITGTGATFTPPPPVADLTDDDFLPPGQNQDPVTITRKRPSDCYNVTRVEFLDSSLCVATYQDGNKREQVGQPYPPTIAYFFNQADIETYGLRPESVQAAHFFNNSQAAQMSAQLRGQRIQARNTYKFTLGWKWIQLDLMDLVTLTESITGLNKQIVRIKEISENDNGDLQITAEDFHSGLGSTEQYNASSDSPTLNSIVASPGSVSAPIIFEPPYSLSGVENSLWIAVGSTNPNWGGCYVYGSTDGTNYQPIGTVTGPSRYGVTTSDYPVGTDPDTTDTLSVNLAASMGALTGGSQSDADQHNLIALVSGEIISFSAATLASPYNYNLGTYIRRGQFGTTIADHPSGSSFVRLDSSVYKGNFQASNIGKVLHFKFCSFNVFGQAIEDLSTVADYTYTPVGTKSVAGSVEGQGALATLDEVTQTQLANGAVAGSLGYTPVPNARTINDKPLSDNIVLVPGDIASSFPPDPHAGTHVGGSDPIAVVSTSAPGLAPQLPNDSTKFLNGAGVFSVPAGGGGGAPGIAPFTAPVLSDFSWVNQGNATAVQQGNAVAMVSATPVAAFNWSLLLKALPAAPYTVTIYYSSLLFGINYQYNGLVLYNSSTGEFVQFGFNINSNGGSLNLSLYKWTSVSVQSAVYVNPLVASSDLWLRIQDDGTNRIFSISIDGYNFLTVYTVSNTDFTTVDRAGFGLCTYSETSYKIAILAKHWNVTTP